MHSKKGTSVFSAKGTTIAPHVFGPLDTQVKSTIPQSDMEQRGDDHYRKGQLAQALASWKEAAEKGVAHTALMVKIELAERELKREGFRVALEEARNRLTIGDFAGAINFAQEARLVAENADQLKETDLVEQDAIEAKKKRISAEWFIWPSVALARW